MRKSLLMAALAAALPFHMSDVTAAAAPAEDPNAGASPAADGSESAAESSATSAPAESDTATTDAPQGDAPAAEPHVDPNAGAPVEQLAPVEQAAADTGNASSADASGSASPDSASSDAAASDTASADAAPVTPVDENTGNVQIAADSHAEAKDRFAGLLAKIHQFEQDTVDELRTELMAIGTLLHLHTKASTDAATTGDYQATDLS